MRTAITVAKTHKGEWQLLGHPDDSLLEQKKTAIGFRAEKAHAEFSTVIYQESDGHALTVRLLTPAQKKAQDEQNAKDHAEAKRFDEGQKEKAAVAKTAKQKKT